MQKKILLCVAHKKMTQRNSQNTVHVLVLLKTHHSINFSHNYFFVFEIAMCYSSNFQPFLACNTPPMKILRHPYKSIDAILLEIEMIHTIF